MNYQKIRLILVAAQEAYDEGVLGPYQYLHLLEDLEAETIKSSQIITEQDFKDLILKYSRI